MTEFLNKHVDGQNLAELRNFKLVQGKLFEINGKNHYQGVTPYPVTPNAGDTWSELDASGKFVEDWIRNETGVLWLSKAKYQHDCSFDGLTTTLRVHKDIPELNGFSNANSPANLFFISLKADFFQTANNSANSEWSISANRISSSNSVNTLATVSNATISANTWGTREAVMNFDVDPVATQMSVLRILVSRIGNPPAITGAAQITYRKSRL
jgi:hypothetical protein